MKGINKLAVGVCGLVEIGCILSLTAIGLKRNNDAYKAEIKLHTEEMDHLCTKTKLIIEESKNKVLEKEIKELKQKYEVKEEA